MKLDNDLCKVVANVDLCSNLIQQVREITFWRGTLHPIINCPISDCHFWFSDSIGNICSISRALERSSWKEAFDNVPLPRLPLGLPLHDRQRPLLPRALCRVPVAGEPLGILRLLRDLPDQRCQKWEILEIYLCYFLLAGSYFLGHFGSFLGHFGSSWVILGHFGPFGDIGVIFLPHWDIWGHWQKLTVPMCFFCRDFMGIFLQADRLHFLQGIGWEKHIKLSGGPRSLVWATKRSQAVWAKGLECPNWPRMAKNIQIAQNAQNGPKCPEWPKRPRMAQNSPEQPKGRKWHTCPKGPEFAQKAQYFQHSGPFWAWPRGWKFLKHIFSGTPFR